MICNFVLTLYKKLPLINKKLFIKFLQYYVKMFIDILNFSNKTETEFYKEKSGTVKRKRKNVKNVIVKEVSYESFSNMYKYSIR